MTTEHYKQEIRDMNGTQIRVTTYKIGDEYFCHVSNFDPDATISRARAGTKEAAVNEAIQKASDRILRYKR